MLRCSWFLAARNRLDIPRCLTQSLVKSTKAPGCSDTHLAVTAASRMDMHGLSIEGVCTLCCPISINLPTVPPSHVSVSTNGGGPFCGCPTTRALLFGIYVRAPDFWKLPYFLSKILHHRLLGHYPKRLPQHLESHMAQKEHLLLKDFGKVCFPRRHDAACIDGICWKPCLRTLQKMAQGLYGSRFCLQSPKLMISLYLVVLGLGVLWDVGLAFNSTHASRVALISSGIWCF